MNGLTVNENSSKVTRERKFGMAHLVASTVVNTITIYFCINSYFYGERVKIIPIVCKCTSLFLPSSGREFCQ